MAKFKVLNTGETDITSTDIWRFCLHSDYPTFKIQTSGSQNFSIAAGESFGEYTVTHSLGYSPVYFANILYGTKSYQIPAAITPFPLIELPSSSFSGTSIINFYSIIDGTNLTIGATTADGELLDSTANFTAYWIINIDEF